MVKFSAQHTRTALPIPVFEFPTNDANDYKGAPDPSEKQKSVGPNVMLTSKSWPSEQKHYFGSAAHKCGLRGLLIL